MKIPLFRRDKTEKAVDPVCKMEVNVKASPGGTYNYSDQTYYFCGPGCRIAFIKEAEEYLSGRKSIEM